MKGFIRSLLILAGLACLPACAASERMPATQSDALILTTPTPQPKALSPVNSSHNVSVYFDKNGADIKASAMQILYGVALQLRGQRITAIRVTGYTDASGRRAYNQDLSRQRAAAVADQLDKLGIRADRTEILAGGELPHHGKRHQAAEDRRVEIVIETQVVTAAAATAPSTVTIQSQADLPTLIAVPAPLSLSPRPLAIDKITVHMPVWLQAEDKPVIKRDRFALGTTWLPPPAA